MDTIEIKKAYQYAIRFSETLYISIYILLIIMSILYIFLIPELQQKEIIIVICAIELMILVIPLVKLLKKLKMCNRVLENLEILETKVNINTSWYRRGRSGGYAYIESSYFDEKNSRIYLFKKKESISMGPRGFWDNPINEKEPIYVLVNRNNYDEYIVLVKEYISSNRNKQDTIFVIIFFMFVFIIISIVMLLKIKIGI